MTAPTPPAPGTSRYATPQARAEAARRIAVAKAAREHGQQLRAGKPVAFDRTGALRTVISR